MTVPALRRCHDELSGLIPAIESAARALADRLAERPETDRVAALGPLQVNDLTVQRCAHVRDALAVLANLENPALVALGCRLQALQLAAAGADFRTAVTALLTGTAAASGGGLCDAAGRLDAVTTVLEGLAAAAPEVAAPLRVEVVERLKPAYTMAGERAILAQFLSGETTVTAPTATEDVEECFL